MRSSNLWTPTHRGYGSLLRVLGRWRDGPSRMESIKIKFNLSFADDKF